MRNKIHTRLRKHAKCPVTSEAADNPNISTIKKNIHEKMISSLKKHNKWDKCLYIKKQKRGKITRKGISMTMNN